MFEVEVAYAIRESGRAVTLEVEEVEAVEGIAVGSRVECGVEVPCWARGDRFGVVVELLPHGVARVLMDKSGLVRRLRVRDELRPVLHQDDELDVDLDMDALLEGVDL